MPAQTLFSGEYQGGAFVEVLGTQGTDPLRLWNAKNVQKQVRDLGGLRLLDLSALYHPWCSVTAIPIHGLYHSWPTVLRVAW